MRDEHVTTSTQYFARLLEGRRGGERMIGSIVRRAHPALVIATTMLIAGCAHLSPPRMEYRAGLALYSTPKFSFQVPAGWRAAVPDDWSRFSITERGASKLSQQGRAQVADKMRAAWTQFAAVFIHDSGAWMHVAIEKYTGPVKLPRGYVLTDIEKESMWSGFSKALVAFADPTDKPRLSLVSLDLKDNVQGAVLFIVYNKRDLSGESVWSVLGFISDTHGVTVEYGMAAGRPSAGIEGLDVVASTFRFE